MEGLPPGHLIKQINNYIYNTDSVIGKGCSSFVYKGRNSQTKDIVAIKVIDVRSAKNEIEKMLIANEIRALSTVAHDNVIKCHEICQTVNNLYVVMDFCEQGSLSDFIKTHGKLREDQALAILYYIAQGLHHIHSKGFLHRDIKPTNILIRNGVPKIADFGFAVPATDAYTKAKYNVGSPLYMSPEAYRRSEYSIASDVWGIGVIFYEMIIGGTPFKGMDYDTMVSKVQSGELFSVLQLSPISKGLLSRMMCVDVKQRMSIDEVLAVLEKNKPNSSQLRAPSPMRALSPMRSEFKQQRSGDNMLLPQNNGSQLRQRSVMNSMENSPIKMLPAAHSHIQEKQFSTREFQDRLLLGELIQKLLRSLAQNCETKQLPYLIFKHWRFNTERLDQLHSNHPDVAKEKQKLGQAAEYFQQPIGEPYFCHLVHRGHPESETYCDFTLFWLRATMKHNEGVLDQLMNTSQLDEGLSINYLRFMLTVRYCQVIDFIRHGESGGLFPPNEVLDWLIRDNRNVTSEAVEYLRAISGVLGAGE